MAETIIMPKLGFNMSVGKLVKWYKKEGEELHKGDAFFSIETDKTNMDIEATGDGIVRRLLIDEGESADVTLPIAIVGSKDEDIDSLIAESMEKLGKVESNLQSQDADTAKPDGSEAAASYYVSSDPQGRDFDIAIIGGGPGGYVAAIKAAQMGKRTCIIEKDKFGGVCLNRGCIPTKSLLRSVEALNEVKESAAFGVVGIDTTGAVLDMARAQERKSTVIRQLVGGVNGLLKANGVTILSGTAVLKDRYSIHCGDKLITADNIIIATGSDVKSLPVKISEGTEIMTSTEALEIQSVPDSLAIIGGGVIGIEFAYMMASLGAKVKVVEFLDRILPMVDEEITRQVSQMLISMGIEIHTSAKVVEIDGQNLVFEKNGARQSIQAEKIMMAVGRIPNIAGIGLEAAGVKTERGAICTDNGLRTNIDNIYAIGDANGKVMLAHTASMEGITAVENICGHRVDMDYDKIPSAIYIQPEVACVGLTEEQAKEKYGSVKVGRFPLAANGKAKVAGNDKGIIKVITEPRYGEIVGVHIFGLHATDMIAEAALAMTLEGTAEEIVKTVHPHPTISEIMHEAFHAVNGKAIHFL